MSEINFLTYASHPQILRKDNLGGLLVHNSYGVFSTAFDGARFSVSAAVRSACPQKEIGRSLRPIVDRTMSNKVRFLLSDTPFHFGVPRGVNSKVYPFLSDGHRILGLSFHHLDPIEAL